MRVQIHTYIPHTYCLAHEPTHTNTHAQHADDEPLVTEPARLSTKGTMGQLGKSLAALASEKRAASNAMLEFNRERMKCESDERERVRTADGANRKAELDLQRERLAFEKEQATALQTATTTLQMGELELQRERFSFEKSQVEAREKASLVLREKKLNIKEHEIDRKYEVQVKRAKTEGLACAD